MIDLGKMQYVYVCKCEDCGHHWRSIIRTWPPTKCPKCYDGTKGTNIQILEQIEMGESFR